MVKLSTKVNRLKVKINKFLVKHEGLFGDNVTIWTAEGWTEHCGRYGKGSLFSMTYDGVFWEMMNVGEHTAWLSKSFEKMVENSGLYYEMGTASEIHFYEV